jgi:hypothetical protein
VLLQIANEPEPVVVGAEQRSIRTYHNTTDCPDFRGHLVHLVDDLHGVQLVGDCQVASGKA